ncbi:peptidase inhibitor 16 [Pygocentrus nattereri]|uniref:SCP domain-containing protein n=1 Tax=Pygocentrus nattereri TaxID=42514 RepID=A0AAR2IJX8_PYGNA|nr:peptidase inhibitor 16 [Pygocentrus nattereri]
MALRWTLLCAGLWMLTALATGHLTNEQKDRIVELHNQYRSMVEPPAANMINMTWDDTPTVMAEGYVAKCIWNHNPDVQDVMGENLFISTGPFDIDKAMSDWFQEYKNYDYETNTCAENEMCGHYTQIVWAKTTKVGCAAHICETVEGLHFQNATMLVCNYVPPGNVVGRKPYEAGKPCSKCPEEMVCVQDMCANLDRNEVPSVEPTELPDVDTPSTWTVEGSGCQRSPAALLLLTGLLASLLWM